MGAKIIHIETATKVCSVALAEDGKLLDVVEENSNEFIHAEKLTLFIDRICKRNQISFTELNAISVTGGPGSYTGLRIGVSTAKGLCFALKIPLISINSLDALSTIAHLKYPQQNICAMIDARRMEVYSCIYNQQKQIIKTLSADILTSETYTEFEPFVAVGDATQKVEELWKNRNIYLDKAILSSAIGQIEIAYQKFLHENFEDIAYYEPKYLKDFVTHHPIKK